MIILDKLKKNRVFKNSIWMVFEKIISIFGLIFVTSFVAKYIGPESFGKLSFAASIFGVVQIFSWFGCDNLIFKRASKNPNSAWALIKYTKSIRNIMYFITGIPVLTYVYYYTDSVTFYFGLASFFASYLMALDVSSIYFNAQLKAYINVISNILGLLFSFISRYVIAFFQIDMIWLVVPIIGVALIPFLIRWYIFNYKEKNNCIGNSNKIKYKRYLFFSGANLVLYTLSVAIFTKTSQFFLGLYSMKDLGIYMVASTLGVSFYSILTAFISSFMSKIYAEKDEGIANQMVAQVNILVIIISLFITLFMYFFGKEIVLFLYGDGYIDSVKYIVFFTFLALISGLSTVSEKYIIKFSTYGAYNFLLKKMVIILILNTFMSYLFIANFGLKGAIFSVLITELLSLTILNYFFKNGMILKLHLLTFKLFFSGTFLRWIKNAN